MSKREREGGAGCGGVRSRRRGKGEKDAKGEERKGGKKEGREKRKRLNPKRPSSEGRKHSFVHSPTYCYIRALAKVMS